MGPYKCGNCDGSIEYGANYCSGCGAKIIWPKEKKTKVETKKKRKSVKLPINPDHLKKIISLDGYVNTYAILMFLFGNFILGAVVSHRLAKIREWFNSLQTDECNTEPFRRHMDSIRRCGIWAIALNTIAILLHITLIANPEAAMSGYRITDQNIVANTIISLIYILCESIGVCTGIYVCRHSNVLLDELDLKKEYTYEFNDKPEIKNKETVCTFKDNTEDKYDDGL